MPLVPSDDRRQQAGSVPAGADVRARAVAVRVQKVLKQQAKKGGLPLISSAQ